MFPFAFVILLYTFHFIPILLLCKKPDEFYRVGCLSLEHESPLVPVFSSVSLGLDGQSCKECWDTEILVRSIALQAREQDSSSAETTYKYHTFHSYT